MFPKNAWSKKISDKACEMLGDLWVNNSLIESGKTILRPGSEGVCVNQCELDLFRPGLYKHKTYFPLISAHI